jgi:hypothetical protein
MAVKKWPAYSVGDKVKTTKKNLSEVGYGFVSYLDRRSVTVRLLFQEENGVVRIVTGKELVFFRSKHARGGYISVLGSDTEDMADSYTLSFPNEIDTCGHIETVLKELERLNNIDRLAESITLINEDLHKKIKGLTRCGRSTDEVGTYSYSLNRNAKKKLRTLDGSVLEACLGKVKAYLAEALGQMDILTQEVEKLAEDYYA